MGLSQGREKRRYQKVARQFNFCYVTSSNDEFSDIISGSGTQGALDAVSSRLSSINLRDRQHGVLDHLPRGFSDKGDFLGSLLAAAERHHGVALPHLLGPVVNLAAKDATEFSERLLGHIASFRERATRGQPRAASRRVLDAFGLVYAASRLARHYGALPMSFSPMESAIACYQLHLATSLPPPRPVDVVAALLDDPEVQRLDRGERLDISEEQFDAAKAFRVDSKAYTELMMSTASAERLFGGWTKVHKHDPDIKLILRRESTRPTIYRHIRKAARDRVVCFRVFPDWPFYR